MKTRTLAIGAAIVLGLAVAVLFVMAWRYSNDLLLPPRPSTLREQRVLDRKSTRLNSSHIQKSRMPSSA